MKMAGQERPLPPQMAKALKSTLNRSFLAIAQKADQLDPQFMGTEKIGGTTYNKVSVKVGDKNVSLFLDLKTHYPQIQQYQQFNPRQGKQVTVENHYSDWKTVGGVTYPYKQVTYMDGKKTAEATYKSHSVNQKKK